MSMRRIFLLVMLLLLKAFSVLAQKLIPEFELASSDLTAQLQPRKDTNDKNCALVKVQFVGEVLDVEGNVVSPLGKHNNEMWVYMPQNSRQIKVITKNFLPVMVTFADFGVEKLEANRTYVLVLNQNGNMVQQAEPIVNVSGSTIIIPVKDGISIDMVMVEAGTFMMGATPEMKDFFSDEEPVHQVNLSDDYYIGKYEVTQTLWQAIMGSNPSCFKGESLPVEQVSWDDCQKFIEKLSAITGRKFRLPTESEWEYAARGGKKSRSYQYSGSNDLEKVAFYSDNSGQKTNPVGQKIANELGIYDMSGNVQEWCQDVRSTYEKTPKANPIGVSIDSPRVCRGGAWGYGASWCRSSCRSGYFPSLRSNDLGFRLAITK